MRSPRLSDLIGTWITNDGDTIILMNDSACDVRNLRYPDDPIDRSPRSFVGKWRFEVSTFGIGHSVLSLRGDYYAESLFVSGNGLLGNSPPWFIFQFIGDPDEMNLYEFRKIQ
jgi:hypothetical protein